MQRGDVGGFLPAVKQLANVAALPGIVKASIALPDVHSGYGFAIGNVAAFDMADPESIVSPGALKATRVVDARSHSERRAVWSSRLLH